MRVEVKAIRSKPAVSLNRAAGTVVLKADDLMDSAILTALSRTMLHGSYPALKTAMAEAAKEEYARMSDGDDFTMIAPRSTKPAPAS